MVTAAAAAVSHKHPQLFINTENDVIHHESAIVGPNGRPVLQILEQNPNYVKSIALAVANNGRKRPLSPISESSQQPTTHHPPPTQIPKPTTNTHMQRPSAIASPSKYSQNSSATGDLLHRDAKSTLSNKALDSVGSAKLVKKDPQYVRSIRIGGGPGSYNLANNTQTKRSLLEANANRRFSSSSSSSSNGPSRRPSVTFADDVGGGSRPGSRKPSVEQDSIVTESLLMMTSGGLDARRLSNASSSNASNSRKTSVSSSQSKSQDEHSTAAPTEIVSAEQDTVDLEAFANSLRKSRPIKQLPSASSSSNSNAKGSSSNNSGSQGSASDELDDTSSSSSNSNEGYTSATPLHERRTPINSATLTKTSSGIPRIHSSKSHKSPFGGIADHYAAAKEIAKEIESYSNGSAKASSKKSKSDPSLIWFVVNLSGLCFLYQFCNRVWYFIANCLFCDDLLVGKV